MRPSIALLGLAATLVTAAPSKAPLKKFTLSIVSPNNTMTSPGNQTSIDGLALTSTHEESETFGYLHTVAQVNHKPREFWLNEKGWLTDAYLNGTLRHAEIAKWAIDDWGGDILTFDLPSGAYEPMWVEWEITSDNFLVPKGKFKAYPWFFSQNDPNPYNNPDPDPHPALNLDAPVGLGAWDPSIRIKGVKVTYSKSTH